MTVPSGLVVLISGNGSNLQAIIDAIESGTLPTRIKAVISNKPQAFGLERARRAGIETAVLEYRGFDDREAYDSALRALIDSFDPEAVILAGFMRILTGDLVRHYEGRLLNVHPSLLPAYKGLHTHQRVIEAGESRHGATVHFVTEALDDGPNIVQDFIDIAPEDTPESLAQRVHVIEHQIYPLAIRWFVEGRLKMEAGKAWMDGQALTATGASPCP